MASMSSRGYVNRSPRGSRGTPHARARALHASKRFRATRTHRAPNAIEKHLLTTNDLLHITHPWKIAAQGGPTYIFALDILFRTPSTSESIKKVLQRVASARALDASSPILHPDVIRALLRTAFAFELVAPLRHLIDHLTTTHNVSDDEEMAPSYSRFILMCVADRMLEFWVDNTAKPPHRSWAHRAQMLSICMVFSAEFRPSLFTFEMDEFARAIERAHSFSSDCAMIMLHYFTLEDLAASVNDVRVDKLKFFRHLLNNDVLAHVNWVKYGPPKRLENRIQVACIELANARSSVRSKATMFRRASV